MPDSRFFKRGEACTLEQLAAIAGADVAPGSDPGYRIEDVAPLDTAGPGDLSFLDNVKYKDQYRITKAGACLVSPHMAAFSPGGVHVLVSKSPYKSYALVAQHFYPEILPPAKISDRASVSLSSKIGNGCVVEPGAVIMDGVQIGDGCWIEANAVIGQKVVLGDHCRVGTNASISHAIIGAYVRLFPGVRIGQDGFGFAPDAAGHIKVPQLGRVIIEDHVEIGANTCIDRGSGPDTVIGHGACIDNMVQIGHNVKIGRGCLIAAQCGFAGSTVVEDYVAMGGQTGIAGHLRIGKGARIAAHSGVMRDVPPGEEQMGFPALPIRQHMRQIATLKRSIKKEKGS